VPKASRPGKSVCGSGKCQKSLAVEPIVLPLFHGRAADPVVEVDRQPVPAKNRPLDPGAIATDGLACDGAEETVSMTLAAPRRNDEEVLEVEFGRARKLE
jgi:hypothetical protein